MTDSDPVPCFDILFRNAGNRLDTHEDPRRRGHRRAAWRSYCPTLQTCKSLTILTPSTLTCFTCADNSPILFPL